MDLNKLIARVKNILLAPKTEWPVIADEPATVADLYKNYIVILAAIPAVLTFVKLSLIGVSMPFAGTIRIGIGSGLANAIIGYLLGLASIYILALIVDALAPSFGGQKSQIQALKTCTYAYTASWVAGIGLILPLGLSTLLAIAGGIYGIYLLYLGLPHTMKSPQDRSAGYTAVTVILAIVIGFIVSLVVGTVVGVGTMAGLSSSSSSSSDVKFDEDSTLGKLEKYAENMEAAGKKMEAAQKSGDSKAQQDAMAGVMGAVFGGGAVESLAPDRLKPFIPESLGGKPRTNISVERNNAMGMQISEARASFSNESGGSIDLEITDMGSAKGLIGLANFAGVEGEKETATGYEKTYRQDGRIISESWDRSSSYGHYSIVLGERFTVKVQGNAGSINELKAALGEINLAGLERLRGEGVKKQ